MRAYRLVRAILRLVVSVFYRQIEIVGVEHVPETGPLILAGNHPNSLLDPLLIIACSRRIVRFAAKDTLFKSPVLRILLDALGAVPVARRSDHGDNADNKTAFETLFRILANGGAMGIFPEGLSHDGAQLAKLKTGAARIALGLAAERPDLEIKVVPVGLVYVHPKRFRSRALVQFGPPISIEDAQKRAFAEDQRAAVLALTSDLDRAIRALTINAEDWDTVRVLDGVRRLYQPERTTLEERVELMRRFNAVYPTVKDEPGAREVYRKVELWLDRLRFVGLTERDLDRRPSKLDVSLRVLGHLLLIFLWLPLAIPGVLIFVPLLITVRIASPRVTPRYDVLATTKLVLGMVLTIGAVGGITASAAWKEGAVAAIVTFIILAGSFHATLRVLERGDAMRRLFFTLYRLLTIRNEIARLRDERNELRFVVAEAVERYRPPEMTPLFPREAPLFDASDAQML